MKSSTLFCFGHRGACGYGPENTLLSVRKALALEANGIEVDVHLVEGRVMVIHDDTLDRTTNGTGPVAGKSWTYLRSLDAGKGERIPTLDQVFDTVNHRAVINVELKGPGTAEPVAQIINQHVRDRCWRLEDFLVSAFDHAQLQAARRLLPKLRTGALIERIPPGLAAFAEGLGAWSVHPSRRCVTPELVADAHQRGLKVFVFTVNRPADIAAMVAMGVDGVFSDFPDRVVACQRA